RDAPLSKTRANGCEIAKRRKVLQRSREQPFASKQLQQSLRSRVNEAIAHRGHDNSAGIDQKLGTGRTRIMLFSEWAEGVTERVCDHSQEATVGLLPTPREQGRPFGHQQLETLTVVVMNDAMGLRRRPLETLTESVVDLSHQFLPPRESVLSRDY